MSTNYTSTAEDADMAECEGEKVVTMMDVLQEQEEFEEDANAVLGASDDKNCTYSKGYIKRQAIYACLTCCSDAKNDPTKRAGVCLACSLNCHENHELIELYTRRNFRCDCGNPKFNSHPCQFTPNKTDLNEDNKYNQNFIGIYCTCHRPYPDPDAINEDEMIQCTICEDWLHASHLEATLPSNDQYAEMICKACMELNEFLHDYSCLAVNVDVEDVDITVTETVTMECSGNENNEKLPNGSFELSPSKQETDKLKNINIAMNISNKIEAMQYKTSSGATDYIEKESTAFINGDVITSNDSNDETLDKENVTSSKAVQLETGDATITEKTNKTEENIVKTNDIVTLSNTLIASGKHYISMENESIHEPNKSNSDESNVCSIDRIKTPLVVSCNENETVLKDETTTNNLFLGHVRNHLDLENLNCKSSQKPLTKIEENENLVKQKYEQDDCDESNGISNKIDTALICLEGSKCEVKTDDQSIEKKDEESDNSTSILTTVVNNGIYTALNNLENTQSEVNIKDHLVDEINLVHSTEESSEVDMVLDNLDNRELVSKIDKPTSETMVTEIDNVGILKSAEVDTDICISVNNFEHNESITKTEEHSTEKINKETEKNDISEHMEVDTNIDVTLNNKENSKSGAQTEETTATIDKETAIKGFTESTKGDTNMDITINNSKSDIEMENQCTETVDKETEKKNISESNDVDTNIDSINNEPETTTAYQFIKLQDTEIYKKDVVESTKVDISQDTTLSNLNNLIDPETKTEECSVKIEGNISEESIDQSDTLEKATRELLELTADMVEEPEEDIMLDNSDTADTSKELNNGEELADAPVLVITNNKENTDTEINNFESEENVNVCDTSQLQITDNRENTDAEINNIETEENVTLNDTSQLQITDNKENTNAEINTFETDQHVNASDTSQVNIKENTDPEIINIETEKNTNISDILQLETFNCNNLERENDHKRKYNEENDDINVKKAKLEEKVCLRPKGVQKIFKGATFWPSDFRQKLCTCNECLTMYKDLKLLFLLDSEDTVTAYETLGKEKIDGAPTTQYEKGLQALSSLDRVQQINALTEYNIMRDKLLDFLKSFKERRVIVKEEDIRAFFADMKPRREPDGVYFCR